MTTFSGERFLLTFNWYNAVASSVAKCNKSYSNIGGNLTVFITEVINYLGPMILDVFLPKP